MNLNLKLSVFFSISLFYLSTIYFAKSEIVVLTSCSHAGSFRVFFLWTTRSLFHLQFLKDYRYYFLHFPPFILEIGTDLPSYWPSTRTSIQVFFAKPTTLVKFGKIFSISLRKSNITDKKATISLYKMFQLKCRDVSTLWCSQTTFHHQQAQGLAAQVHL